METVAVIRLCALKRILKSNFASCWQGKGIKKAVTVSRTEASITSWCVLYTQEGKENYCLHMQNR